MQSCRSAAESTRLSSAMLILLPLSDRLFKNRFWTDHCVLTAAHTRRSRASVSVWVRTSDNIKESNYRWRRAGAFNRRLMKFEALNGFVERTENSHCHFGLKKSNLLSEQTWPSAPHVPSRCLKNSRILLSVTTSWMLTKTLVLTASLGWEERHRAQL